jgi:hypothetical protein
VRPERAAVAALVVVVSLVRAAPAAAFCRTTTVTAPKGYDPSETLQCWGQGIPVYWASACVGYDLQADAGDGITYGEASAALSTAFALWTGATCPQGGNPSISTVSGVPVECNLAQYNECGPNQHVIAFQDTWPYADTSNELALTTVSYDLGTGELYDADMEINATMKNISIGSPVPEGSYDFASIVTHETGHFLGMAHAKTTAATMYAHLSLGETRRALSDDDVAGVCAIYPPNGTRAVVTDAGAGFVDATTCDPTPRHGFTTACMPTPPPDGGIACEPPPSSGCAVGGTGTSGAWAWLAALAWCAGRRRRMTVPRLGFHRRTR